MVSFKWTEAGINSKWTISIDYINIYRLIFIKSKKNEIPGRNLLKVVKFKIWLKML